MVNRIQRPLFDLIRLLPSKVSAKAAIERLVYLTGFRLEGNKDKILLQGNVTLKIDNLTFAYSTQTATSSSSSQPSTSQPSTSQASSSQTKPLIIRPLVNREFPYGQVMLSHSALFYNALEIRCIALAIDHIFNLKWSFDDNCLLYYSISRDY